MENYKFINHKSCEFFPCHKTGDPDKFNCLFCYCPLYTLGDKCGGNFKYTDTDIKDCSDCLIPHSQGAYDYIIGKSRELIKLASDNHEKE